MVLQSLSEKWEESGLFVKDVSNSIMKEIDEVNDLTHDVLVDVSEKTQEVFSEVSEKTTSVLSEVRKLRGVWGRG